MLLYCKGTALEGAAFVRAGVSFGSDFGIGSWPKTHMRYVGIRS
jgi:hypothetical protein